MLQDPSPPPVLEGRAWPSQRPQSPAMPQTPNSSPPDQGAYPPVVHSSQDYLPASSAPVEVTPCCPAGAPSCHSYRALLTIPWLCLNAVQSFCSCSSCMKQTLAEEPA